MELMVADDDPVARRLVRRVLEDDGHNVHLAACGAEALELWERLHPPLVLTDWMMPGLDGEALCRHIRDTPRDRYTYVILLTSLDAQESVRRGLTAGADDYIAKPFDPIELLLRVKAGVRIVELESSLGAKILELNEVLARVRTLEGMLPVCSYCKKIRDDAGEWCQVETYIEAHSEATFTHGYCPDCLQEIVWPELERLTGTRRDGTPLGATVETDGSAS